MSLKLWYPLGPTLREIPVIVDYLTCKEDLTPTLAQIGGEMRAVKYLLAEGNDRLQALATMLRDSLDELAAFSGEVVLQEPQVRHSPYKHGKPPDPDLPGG